MIKFNSKQFKIDLTNIVEYSVGFLDGIHAGKKVFLNNLGKESVEVIKQFIDSNAKADPAMLAHVYEWYQVGSPDARLYDINYTVSNLGLSFLSTFKQSSTIKDGSREPFYNKARIMEEGIPVVIRPKVATTLVFEQDGETIFTKNAVKVDNPGGVEAQGGFQKMMDIIFSKYFSQALLRTTGLDLYLNNPRVYKTNMAAGKRSGRSAGYPTGFKWIANAGVVNG